MTRISLKDVYGDDAGYVDGDSAAAIEGMPANAWGALIEGCEALTGGTEPGIDCPVSKTHETIADFDNSRATYWSERGQRFEETYDGKRAVRFENLQLKKGTRRIDTIVIDLGDCRAVLTV